NTPTRLGFTRPDSSMRRGRSFCQSADAAEHKTDKNDRRRLVCSANVYTSKARARDFRARTVQTNSSRLARFADNCGRWIRLSDETPIDSGRSAAVRCVLE